MRRSARHVLVILLLLGMAANASAKDAAELTAPLLAARERGAFGSVDGRAYAEGQRGGAEPTPYPAVSVLLLPRSEAFEAEIEGIKASHRDRVVRELEGLNLSHVQIAQGGLLYHF